MSSRPARPILVVDDNPSSLKLVSYLASRNGWDVVEAGSATEAMAAIDRRIPRLVLVDRHMPGATGIDFVRMLKSAAATAEMPVVMISASYLSEHREEAYSIGVSAYVTKQIDTRTLPELLDSLVA